MLNGFSKESAGKEAACYISQSPICDFLDAVMLLFRKKKSFWQRSEFLSLGR